MNLRVTPAEGEPYSFVVTEASTTVGRSSGADLALADPFLSRQHARLVLQNNVLSVEDLGSRNGTFVNGEQITGLTPLEPGDEIRLSASLIELERDDRTSITHVTTQQEDAGATIYRPAKELLTSDTQTSSDDIDSTEALRRYAEKLEILKRVHEALARPMDERQLLDLILDRAFDHLQPQQGVIYLREDDGEYYQAATRALPGVSRTIPLSETLVAEVLDKGMAALVLDVMTDDRFQASESILTSGVRSMLATPLLDAEGPMGMIVLNSTVAARQFAEADLELLVSLASIAALKLRNLGLSEEAAKRRVLEEELAVARRIQLQLLSKDVQAPPGYSVLGRNEPSRGVSGDFYQVTWRKKTDEWVFFAADVSGKGMAASLLTMSLEALAVAPIDDGESTDSICSKVSRRLFQRTPPEKYATAFVAVLNPHTGILRYTNAGHNTALLCEADGTCHALSTSGLPIGLMPVAVYEERRIEMTPGATLLIYTDGITEAENPEGEEYGLDRLQQVLLRSRQLEAEEIADAIEADLDAFSRETPYFDDRTMVIVQRDGGEATISVVGVPKA